MERPMPCGGAPREEPPLYGAATAALRALDRISRKMMAHDRRGLSRAGRLHQVEEAFLPEVLDIFSDQVGQRLAAIEVEPVIDRASEAPALHLEQAGFGVAKGEAHHFAKVGAIQQPLLV